MSSLRDLLPAPKDGLTLSTPQQPSVSKLTVTASVPSPRSGVSRVVALPTTDDGAPDFSAVLKQGENASRTVHTSALALIEKPRSEALQPLPTQEQADNVTSRTRQALQRVVDGKISQSKTVAGANVSPIEKPTFIRYTPANSDAAGKEKRIIKMVDAPVDPMLPPKFAHKKAPVNPPSPPVPVMHSPERKLSKEEVENWRIPPVVSNWKNNRGYTISLEKRLAADGRGQIDHSINDRFTHLAEALYNVERNARSDVERRAVMQRKVALRAKEQKERELRDLAERARRERRGYLGIHDATDTESMAPSVTPSMVPSVAPSSSYRETTMPLHDTQKDANSPSIPSMQSAREVPDEAPPDLQDDESIPAVRPRRRRRSRFESLPSEEQKEPENRQHISQNNQTVSEADVRRRDEIREERRFERERELRQSRLVHGESTGPTLRRSKLVRDGDRDIAERVALGQDVKKNGKEILYDQRLFNQGTGNGQSLAGGYGAEDSYNLYDRPLFTGGRSNQEVYRPQKNMDRQRGRGAVGEAEQKMRARPRERPVEFERDTEVGTMGGGDLYGLDAYADEARTFKKPKRHKRA